MPNKYGAFPISKRRAKLYLAMMYGQYCSNPCCQRRGNTLDHIKPHSKGGSNELKNLQLLCNRCNLLKGDRELTLAELCKETHPSDYELISDLIK